MKFKHTITLLYLLLSMILFVLLVVFMINFLNNMMKTNENTIKTELANIKGIQIRETVGIAYNRLLSLNTQMEYELAQIESETEKAILINRYKARAVAELSEYKFDGGESYLYGIDQSSGNNIYLFHSTQPFIKGMVVDLEDIDPKVRIPYMQKIFEKAKEQSPNVRYVKYYSETESADQYVLKVVYPKYFAPWDWIILGEYSEAVVNRSFADIHTSFLSTRNFNFLLLGIISLILIILFCFLVFYILNKMLNPLKVISDNALEISRGNIVNFENDIKKINKDEIGRVIYSYSKMIENFSLDIVEINRYITRFETLIEENDTYHQSLLQMIDKEMEIVQKISSTLDTSLKAMSSVSDDSVLIRKAQFDSEITEENSLVLDE
ncbi:MAG: cache domain-containing protein, partial [Spirochaetes bacterium]|nr:cache domain-containing protein [Spirochaetota bacterium]